MGPAFDFLIQLLRVVLALPIGIGLWLWLRWEGLILVFLFFGVYLVVSLLLHALVLHLRQRRPGR